MSAFIDTLMNVNVFVFIAAMIWLYFREEDDEGGCNGDCYTDSACRA